MSGKRRAAEQLTDSNAYRREEEDEEEDNNEHTQKQATAEVLSRRKILKPRGLKTSSNASSFTPKNPSPLVISSPVNNAKQQSIDRNSRIKALNSNFVQAVTNAQNNNVIADLRPILNKYISFYDEIIGAQTNGEITNDIKASQVSTFQPQIPTPQESKPSAFSFLNKNSDDQPKTNAFGFLQKTQQEQQHQKEQEPKQTATNITEPTKSDPKPIEVSESESDSDDEIKVEGPKFTLEKPPTTKNSVFTFGAKPKPEIEFSDSDSEDDIKVEGPTFTLNTNPTESKSFFGGFKLSDNTGGFKFSLPKTNEAVENEKKETTTSKPAFNFQPTPSVTNSTTNNADSTSKETKEDKPTFSFGKTSDSKPNTLIFSFGNNSNDKQDKQDKPSFSFKSIASTEPEKDKPSFSFASTASTEPEKIKPSFSFGSNASENDKDKDKPKFSLGSTTTTTTIDKPSFSFAGTTGTQTKPFSFSSSSETTEPKKDDEPKPFSFGSNTSKTDSTSETKPSFSFGGDKPFQFNTNNAAVEDKPKSSFQSNFNFGVTSSTFNFTPNSSSNTTTTPAAAATTSGTTGAGEEEKVEDHEPNVDFKPVVTLDKEAETKTGEEDEIVKYTKRAKLSLLADNEYQSKGLGELKILFNSNTSKTRVLIRADGSLRVLLNSLIHKNFKFEKLGKGNLVKFPTINKDGDLETYLIQVKTSADGDDLLKAIEDGKC